jgi:hypothetical protein
LREGRIFALAFRIFLLTVVSFNNGAMLLPLVRFVIVQATIFLPEIDKLFFRTKSFMLFRFEVHVEVIKLLCSRQIDAHFNFFLASVLDLFDFLMRIEFIVNLIGLIDIER